MLLRYLKSRIWSAAVLALFSAVFAAVFALCGLPLNAVAYAFLICASIGICLLAADYARFFRKYRALEHLKHCPEDAADALPAPVNEIERGYQAIIASMREYQLAQAQKNRESLATRSDYYTVWAHQIKTPIAAMRLILQEMDGGDVSGLRGELKRIEQYAEMALCYIRLDSPDTDYLIRRCDLDDIIRSQLRAASPLFIRSRLMLDYRPLHFSVLTDEKWLAFVIGQILSNAVKYTPTGGSIRIDMPREGVLAISDTGIGIPAEDLPRVTESGFTGQNGRDDKRATGIGLYLCRRILTHLGHEMQIQSRRGEGTQVFIDLNQARFGGE